METSLKQIAELGQIKGILLDALVFLDKLCIENGINYSLAYGTLIGAIRHNGFIPWDDDIDVYMPRKDFNKLIRVLSDHHDSRYKLYSIETDDKYDSVIPKLVDTSTYLYQKTAGSQFDKFGNERYELGLYIDIFVLDSFPNEKERQTRILRHSELLQRAWGYCFFKPHNDKKNLVNLLRTKMNGTNLAWKIARMINSYSKSVVNKDAELLSNIMYGGIRGINDCCTIADFTNFKEVDFEGHKMRAIKNYDTVLRGWFGDYMTPPPPNERVSNHTYTAYWR